MPGQDSTRPRSNVAEARFEQYALQAGWRPTKRGWPDFLCWSPAGEVIAVEVKPRTASGRLGRLKRDQVATMRLLSAHGIRCYVSDGTRLEPFRDR